MLVFKELNSTSVVSFGYTYLIPTHLTCNKCTASFDINILLIQVVYALFSKSFHFIQRGWPLAMPSYENIDEMTNQSLFHLTLM